MLPRYSVHSSSNNLITRNVSHTKRKATKWHAFDYYSGKTEFVRLHVKIGDEYHYHSSLNKKNFWNSFYELMKKEEAPCQTQ